MTASPDLATALDAVRAVAGRALTASDDELLADLGAVEAIGRVVDGLRVVCAAEVDRRSGKGFGEDGLAFRRGARDGANLVADITRVSVPEARRRIGLGAALAPRGTLLGDPLPSRYPVLTAAVTAGDVGLESARIVLEAAQRVRRRAAPAAVEEMVAALTGYAAEHAADLVRIAATAWQAAVDPDGPEPDASGRNAERRFTLGRVWANGTQSFTGVLDPEHRAMLREALQSRRRGILLERTQPGGSDEGDDCGTLEAEWREPGDPRARAQADYDTLAQILSAGLAAEADGHAPTTTIHEVVVTATVTDLEARRGQGWAPGVLAGLPMPTIERLTCTSGMRLLVTGLDGEPLYLSRTKRVFSPAQKKALLAAGGGRCGIPHCTASAAFLEAHHVHWWNRDTGPTDIGNGPLLAPPHAASRRAEPLAGGGPSCSADTTTRSYTRNGHPSASTATKATSTSSPRSATQAHHSRNGECNAAPEHHPEPEPPHEAHEGEGEGGAGEASAVPSGGSRPGRR